MTAEKNRMHRDGRKTSSVRGHLNIELLDGNSLSMEIHKSTEIAEIFKSVCEQLAINERLYFGLCTLVAGEFLFVNLQAKLSDVFKLPKRSKRINYDEKTAYTLHFRIQFYVVNASVLRERNTRHQYYLQLKANLLDYSQQLTDEQIFAVAAYALQCDRDDITTSFDPRQYFPASYVDIKGSDFLTTNIPKMQRILDGICSNETKMIFIRDLSYQPTAHNLHFYRLKLRKHDKTITCIAICPIGIQIYEIINGIKNLKTTFLWSDIDKLTFEKKKFSIKTMTIGRKFTYFTESEFMAKYLLKQSQLTHEFYVNIQRKIKELNTMAEEDRKSRDRLKNDESSLDNSRQSLSYRSTRSTCSLFGGRLGCRATPISYPLNSSASNGNAGFANYCSSTPSSRDGSMSNTPTDYGSSSADYGVLPSADYGVLPSAVGTLTAAAFLASQVNNPYPTISPSGGSLKPTPMSGLTPAEIYVAPLYADPPQRSVHLSRHFSDCAAPPYGGSRGSTPGPADYSVGPPTAPAATATTTSRYLLQRHFSERKANSTQFSSYTFESLPNPELPSALRSERRRDSVQFHESRELHDLSFTSAHNQEIMIDSPPVSILQYHPLEADILINSTEKLKPTLPMIRIQNDRRSSVQIITSPEISTDHMKLSLDVNSNNLQTEKLPDFLLEVDTPLSDRSEQCPLHGTNGNILFESFKNHSLPMLSGLLADMNLCACHKADKAFDRLFSSGGGVAGGETAVHIASNLHPAAVKRRALSDPKETFSLSPPPPMYVPPALTVE